MNETTLIVLMTITFIFGIWVIGTLLEKGVKTRLWLEWIEPALGKMSAVIISIAYVLWMVFIYLPVYLSLVALTLMALPIALCFMIFSPLTIEYATEALNDIYNWWVH